MTRWFPPTLAAALLAAGLAGCGAKTEPKVPATPEPAAPAAAAETKETPGTPVDRPDNTASGYDKGSPLSSRNIVGIAPTGAASRPS